MSGSHPNEQSQLTESLRQMVLGNVAISNSKQPSQDDSYGSRRQHGRGHNRNENTPTTAASRHPQSQQQAQSRSTDQQPSTLRAMQRPHQNTGSHTQASRAPRSQNSQGHLAYPNQDPPPNRPYPHVPTAPKSQNPQGRPACPHPQPHITHHSDYARAQAAYLGQIASHEVSKVEFTLTELEEKEAFRKELEYIFKKAITFRYSGTMRTIQLVCFGSLASGFGMPVSDMDLAIVPVWKDPSKSHDDEIDREIPRLLEGVIIDSKMGGRLLTRPRIPILKICQKPTDKLYEALLDERQRWEALPEKEKYPAPLPPARPSLPRGASSKETSEQGKPRALQDTSNTKLNPNSSTSSNTKETANKKRSREKPWTRERALRPLDFPKTGVGIQCDINFNNPLGIHNTHLLRCYSLTDPRVRPIVLFVKAWAKRRKINSSYSGTLSSYGWVLMVLHYLVNVVKPPLCPNLQLLRELPHEIRRTDPVKSIVVSGYNVLYWNHEHEIILASQRQQLTKNEMSVGALLGGFFHYYACPPVTSYPILPSFNWRSEVLSLRTPGGIRLKAEKGWTALTTEIIGGKEIRSRHLLAIEDPFELDHNVARTVVHNGIVAIRDEFRRAWRIIDDNSRGVQNEDGLFDKVVEEEQEPAPGARIGALTAAINGYS